MTVHMNTVQYLLIVSTLTAVDSTKKSNYAVLEYKRGSIVRESN